MGAVVENARAYRLLSISENVMNLACVGRMTCKVRHDFKIITHELSCVLRQFHWWQWTFWDLRFVLQNLYIRKQFRRFWQVSKQVRQRSRRPNPSYPACYDPTVRNVSTAGYHRHLPLSPRRREGKNITKWTLRTATIVVQVNKKRLLFFSLKFRVWVFLFLWTPFFKTQHFSPMVQKQANKKKNNPKSH